MEDQSKNYIFDRELAEFYLEDTVEEKAFGTLSISEFGKIHAELTSLSSTLKKTLETIPEMEGEFKTLPYLFGKIMRTGQPFYLLTPQMIPSKFSLMTQKSDPNSFWEINPPAILIPKYAQENNIYIENSFPISISASSIQTKSILWNLDTLKEWTQSHIWREKSPHTQKATFDISKCYGGASYPYTDIGKSRTID